MTGASRKTSLPKWLGTGRRSMMSCTYVFKLLMLLTTCVLLGYSMASFYSADDVSRGPLKASEWSFGGSQNTLTAEGYEPTPEMDDTTGYLTEVSESDLHRGTHLSASTFYDRLSDKLTVWSDWAKQRGSGVHNHTMTEGERLAAGTANSPANGPIQVPPQMPAQTSPQGPEKDPKTNGITLNETGEILFIPDNTYNQRPLVGKLTILFGDDNSVYERAIRSHETHNRMHSYPMHTLRNPILNDVWSKPAYIMSVLLRELAKPVQERLQWLLWVDADTIILNPRVPIEVFLPPRSYNDIHMLVSHDWNGLNNGVFPIRVHQWSVDLMAGILAFTHFRPDTALVFRDQSAMAELLKEPKFSQHIAKIPQRWFNAYQGELHETTQPYQVRRGDLLVHFAGVGNRDERMEYWLERAELHTDEWEVELRYTSYPSEVKEFWTEFGRQRKQKNDEIEKMQKKANELIEKKHNDYEAYKDRLDEGQRKKIVEIWQSVKDAMGDDAKKHDVEIIKKQMDRLNEGTKPINDLIEKEQKVLLKEAHAVLFEAEKAILDEVVVKLAEAESKSVDTAIGALKDFLLEKPLVTAKVTEAVTTLKSKYRELKSKLDKMRQEQAAKADKEAEEKRVKEAEIKAKEEEAKAKEAEAETKKKEEEEEKRLEMEKIKEAEAEAKKKEEAEKKAEEERADQLRKIQEEAALEGERSQGEHVEAQQQKAAEEQTQQAASEESINASSQESSAKQER